MSTGAAPLSKKGSSSMMTMQRYEMQARYFLARQRELRKWIESVIKEPLPSDDMYESLKDGKFLCLLLNAFRPNTIPTKNIHDVSARKSAVAQYCIENLKFFLDAARKLGVRDVCTFEPLDLYEKKNLGKVLLTMQEFYKIVKDEAPEWEAVDETFDRKEVARTVAYMQELFQRAPDMEKRLMPREFRQRTTSGFFEGVLAKKAGKTISRRESKKGLGALVAPPSPQTGTEPLRRESFRNLKSGISSENIVKKESFEERENDMIEKEKKDQKDEQEHAEELARQHAEAVRAREEERLRIRKEEEEERLKREDEAKKRRQALEEERLRKKEERAARAREEDEARRRRQHEKEAAAQREAEEYDRFMKEEQARSRVAHEEFMELDGQVEEQLSSLREEMNKLERDPRFKELEQVRASLQNITTLIQKEHCVEDSLEGVIKEQCTKLSAMHEREAEKMLQAQEAIDLALQTHVEPVDITHKQQPLRLHPSPNKGASNSYAYGLLKALLVFNLLVVMIFVLNQVVNIHIPGKPPT